MKYLNRPLSDWKKHGYNPIHLFGDYYLLRNCSKRAYRFSTYSLAKIIFVMICKDFQGHSNFCILLLIFTNNIFTDKHRFSLHFANV